MAMNEIQFKKGMSIPDFMKQYGSEEKCRSALFSIRWPNGFRCPKCGNKTYYEIKKRNVFQCNRCHFQTSVIAGTIFHSSNLPLTKWFLAMFLMTQSKKGISALELSRQIGASYNATWRLKHKLMKVMLQHGSTKKRSFTIIPFRFQNETNHGTFVPWPDHDESTKNW